MKHLIKSLYNAIPGKNHIYNLLKRVYTPSEKIYRHLHFKGSFPVSVEPGVTFIIQHHGYQVENEIFWKGLTGSWEKESIKLWIRLCRNSSVILDIGANTGVYSLIAKAINPQASVYAFEPVARVFLKLKENIDNNNFNIVPIEKAVSNADGTAVIYDTNAEHTYSVTVNKNMSSSDLEIIETQINTISLNSFIKEYGVSKIDLMKIDVETHEPEVLEGCSSYLKLFKPVILIEILNDEVAERVNQIVAGLGYLYFNIDEEKGIRQVNSVTNTGCYNYLLCTPADTNRIGLAYSV